MENQTRTPDTRSEPHTNTRTRLAQRFTEIIDIVARVVSLVTIAAIIIHVMMNVLLRTAFSGAAPGTLEYTQYWYLPMLVMFGILSAQIHNENLRADILFSRFTTPTRLWLARATNIISAGMCGILGYYTLRRALEDFGYRTTTQGHPIEIWQVSFVYPFCFFVLAIIFIAQLVLPGLSESVEDEPDGTSAASGTAQGSDSSVQAELNHALSVTASETPATRTPISSGEIRSKMLLTVLLVIVLGSAGAMFMPIEGQAIGLLGILMMLGMLFLRVPIAIALILPATVAMLAMRGIRTTEGMLTAISFDAVPKWSLIVIPMFVLMGFLIWRAGITKDLYGAARNWLGWLPGGLAVGTNTAGSGLAAVSGSTLGTTHALGRIGIPEMIKSGYDPRVAIAAVMAAGLPGQLIPPSIMLVIYAGIAETPIGDQLLAGVVPGVLVSVIFSASFVMLGLLKPEMAGRGPEARAAKRLDSLNLSWPERFLSLGKIWPVVLLIGVVIVGMYTGVLTATEVGAAAALLALIITVTKLRKNRPLSVLATAAIETARSTGAIFFLLIGANALSRMLSLSGLSGDLAEFIGGLGLDKIQFLLILVLFYLVLGMFLDPLAMMLLTIPVLMPTLLSLDISLVWFGVFIVFMAELAILTPPVGILSFVVHSIVQDRAVSMGRPLGLKTVFSAAIMIVPVSFVFLLVLIFVPELATFLPEFGGATE